MNDFVSELLDGIKTGDRVRVRVGTGSSQEIIEGTIEKWSDYLLFLRKTDGGLAKIALNDLRMIDPVSVTSFSGTRDSSATIPNVFIPAVMPSNPYVNAISRSFYQLNPAQSVSYVTDSIIAEIKAINKSISNQSLKQSMGGVLDSLVNAIKCNQVKDKYHNLRAKLLRESWDQCKTDNDFQAFYFLVGALAIVSSDFQYALEPLVRAKHYKLAAYAAASADDAESAQAFTVCGLLNGESIEIDQYFSSILVQRMDVQTLKNLLETFKNNPAQSEKLATCAYNMFSASNAVLKATITPYSSAYSAANDLLSSIPTNMANNEPLINYWNLFSGYRYPTDDDAAEREEYYVSTITHFNETKGTGFIKNSSYKNVQKADFYFYIAQVRDDTEQGTLLRKLLFNELADSIEVRFKLGKSYIRIGSNAAYSVELTDVGYAEGIKRLDRFSENLGTHTGFVERYNQSTQNGIINYGSRTLVFSLSSIIDPWLRAYYRECFPIKEQNVSFEISGTNAKNIRWHNPKESERLLYSNSVTDEEISQWEDYQASSTSQMSINACYASYPYQPLEAIDLEPESKQEKAQLTWGGVSIIGKKKSNEIKTTSTSNTTSGTQASGVTPTTSTQPIRIVPTLTGSALAERARNESIKGDLEAAEKDFSDYLLKFGFSESVVCGYVTLCIRLGKDDKALELIEKYEASMSKDKVLNLKIQAYEKKRDYARLLSLYEESLQRATTFTKKSHNLYRKIDALIKLGRYEDALKDCKRWETILNQNRFSADADKVKVSTTNIKRFRAICYYYTGNGQEAERLAADLLRANPQDTAAIGIVEGTLGATVLPDDEPLFIEDDNPESTELSRFVRNKVNQTDIAVSLKSSKLKDGKYLGTVKEGLKDIEDLARSPRGMRRTLNARCEALFAACKLWEQIETKPDFLDAISGKQYSQHYKYRLAGRAMASWGDTMVPQLQQIDTTRMAYLYALKVLVPSKRGSEQDWINCYNRFIRSFFVARIGSNSLDEYINQQTNSESKDPANTNILIGNRLADVLVPEFVVGILLLVLSLREQEEKRETLISDLYSKNVEIRTAICKQLTNSFDLPSAVDEAIDKFRNNILLASELLERKTKLFQQKIKDLTDRLLSENISSNEVDELGEEYWKPFLTATDVRYLKKYQFIVRRSRDFFQSLDFDNRADCLHAMSLEISDLIKEVENGPTDVSYDILMPSLEQIAFYLCEVQTKLFRDYQPKITLKENIQPYRTPAGYVEIRLSVRNETNYQSAEAFHITNVYGTDVIRFISSTPARNIRGGESIEVGFEVQISEKSNSLGSFSARIAFSYSHDDENQTVTTKSTEIDLTFYIRSENFVQIENPFDGFVGKVMTNAAMFVGRESQIEQLVRMVFSTNETSMNYGRAVAMYGQTRTGKSSIMYHFARKLKENYSNSVLVWDMGNLGENDANENYRLSFIYSLLSTAEESLEDYPDVADAMSEYKIEDILEKLEMDDPLAVSMFNRYLQKLDIVLRKQNKIIVLMVDEFTYLHKYIKDGIIPNTFMQFWKALLQNHCIFAVVVAQDDMPEFMKEYPNEFAAMELIKLNYLDEADAKKLIRIPLMNANGGRDVFADSDPVDELYKLTAGSAYLTIILCSNLVKYINEKGAYTVTKGIVEDFLRTKAFGLSTFLTEEYFEPQLDERGHDELKDINRAILTQIARLSKGIGYAHVADIRYDGCDESRILEFVQRLCDRDVLLKEGRDRYRIKVKLFERWLIYQEGD